MNRYLASVRLNFLLWPTRYNAASFSTVLLLLQIRMRLFTEQMVSSGQEASVLALVAYTPLTLSMHVPVPHSIVLVVAFLC